MLFTRDSPQKKRPMQTESEGIEKNVTSKWTLKKKVRVTIPRENRFQNKVHKKRQRRTLHNN